MRSLGIVSTYGFAELAGDAAFFAGGVSSEGVLASESGGDGTLVFSLVFSLSL